MESRKADGNGVDRRLGMRKSEEIEKGVVCLLTDDIYKPNNYKHLYNF